jgi:hypothetical protein
MELRSVKPARHAGGPATADDPAPGPQRRRPYTPGVPDAPANRAARLDAGSSGVCRRADAASPVRTDRFPW